MGARLSASIVSQIRFFPCRTATAVVLRLDPMYDAYRTAFYLEPGARDYAVLPDP